MAGVVLFAFSSLGCALSTTLEMLTAFRVIQGFGAAAVLSVNAALIREIYPARLLGRGLGINVMVVSVSAAAGPSIASAILSQTSWNWLFTINVPIACLSLLLSVIFLGSRERRSVGFDSGGALLVFVLFIAFSLSTMSMTTHHLPAAALSFAVFAGLAGLLYINQKKGRRRADPDRDAA